MKSKYNIEDVEDIYSDCFARAKYRCAALNEMQCKNGKNIDNTSGSWYTMYK